MLAILGGLLGLCIGFIVVVTVLCWCSTTTTKTPESTSGEPSAETPKQQGPAPTAAVHRWCLYAFGALAMISNGAVFNRNPELSLTEGAIMHTKDTFVTLALPQFLSALAFLLEFGISVIIITIICFTILLIRARYRARRQTPDIESQAEVRGNGVATQSCEKDSASVAHLTEALPTVTEKLDNVDSQVASSGKREL